MGSLISNYCIFVCFTFMVFTIYAVYCIHIHICIHMKYYTHTFKYVFIGWSCIRTQNLNIPRGKVCILMKLIAPFCSSALHECKWNKSTVMHGKSWNISKSHERFMMFIYEKYQSQMWVDLKGTSPKTCRKGKNHRTSPNVGKE